MRESQVAELEKRISESLQILEPFFPQHRENSAKPYANIEHINGESRGAYHLVRMNYDESAFKTAPNVRDFSLTFRGFCTLMGIEGKVKEKRSCDGVRIKTPKYNPTIVASLDTECKHICFGYKKGDEEAQIIMSMYIKKFMNGRA